MKGRLTRSLSDNIYRTVASHELHVITECDRVNTSSCFRSFQIALNCFELLQIASNCFRLFQIASNCFELLQVALNRVK